MYVFVAHVDERLEASDNQSAEKRYEWLTVQIHTNQDETYPT